MNYLLVPHLAHAGLALAIGLGALLNAGWLLVGLKRRGAYAPLAGWGRYLLQVLAGSALLAVFLLWAASQLNWVQADAWQRIGALALIVLGAAVVYFGTLLLAGVQLRQFVKR